MEVTRLAEGLWRWTALHPDWTPDDGGPDGWEQEVSSVYLEAPDHVVLIDPLVPADERDRFFEALDRDVERAGRPVAIAITCESHGRSAAELRERYDAEVWAPAGAVGRTSAPVTRPFAPGDRLAGGLEALDVGFPARCCVWIPQHATLVAGDAILGTPEGPAPLPRLVAPGRARAGAVQGAPRSGAGAAGASSRPDARRPGRGRTRSRRCEPRSSASGSAPLTRLRQRLQAPSRWPASSRSRAS